MAITNYVDVGLEVATDYATANGDTPPANGAALAVAWQVHGYNMCIPTAGKWCAECFSAMNCQTTRVASAHAGEPWPAGEGQGVHRGRQCRHGGEGLVSRCYRVFAHYAAVFDRCP